MGSSGSSLQLLSRRALGRSLRLPMPEARRRWDEALQRDDKSAPALLSVLDDWAEFSGLDYRSMLAQVLEAQGRVDRQWQELRPQTPAEVTAFYDQTDTLVPLLAWWHGTEPTSARCAAAAISTFTAIGARRVLDFGCGIGSTALALARARFDVVIAEVSGEALRFAEWRLRRRGLRADALDLRQIELDSLGPHSVDGVIAFDVFEHLADPTSAVQSLDRLLRPGGVLCCNQVYIAPDRDEPEHFPSRGRVLRELHRRGYRLAHCTDVTWAAQKAWIPAGERLRQGADLWARIGAVSAVEGRGGFVGRRVKFHLTRHLLT